ncbi:MAG: hypothetical protein E6J17_06965 [Chloroflexi bacterium]|nr:MAG: hypothetical protein E6J17_06965 [Chloroflexota bacterium]
MLQVTTTKITERDPTAFNSPTLLLGKIAGKDIPQGKQLTADDFNRGGNQASVTVPAGMRAIAVTVDQGSGVGALIHTGDYVDLLVGITGDKFPVISLTDSNTFQVVSGINATSVKLLLQGMQVIGTLSPPPTAAQAQAQASRGQREPEQPVRDRHPRGLRPAVRSHQVLPAGRLDLARPPLSQGLPRRRRQPHRPAAGRHHRHHPPGPRR